jgi:hypothetical protein
MSVSYDNVKHRSQGIDATLANNEQIIRTTDITAKPRSYVGEHVCLLPACVDPINRRNELGQSTTLASIRSFLRHVLHSFLHGMNLDATLARICAFILRLC